MPTKKLHFRGLLEFRSKKWFWPFFTGAFLGLGYSLTNNILVSQSDTKQSNQEDVNRSFLQEKSISLKNSSPANKKERISQRKSTLNIEKNNPLNQFIKNRNNSVTEVLKVPKKINIIISDNSFLSFSIEFSEKINNIKQSAYKKNLAFFQEQDVKSLLRSLEQPKITKSYRVKAD